jgi:geranylgeranyl pyrophosphate synthase
LVRADRFVKADSFPYDIGAVVELYNWMNTYAFDDVFDNSRFRQKAKTVWSAFSRRDAICTGILGHLLTLKYLFAIAAENPEVAKTLAGIMNDYNRMMYEGQVFDIMLTFDNPKKKALLKKKNLNQLLALYIKRIYGICGGFYEAIGELAAKAGNKEMQVMNAAEVDHISPLIGMYYGIIQMMRNDLGDFVAPADAAKISKGMKDVSHSDVIEGKTSIAYLVAFRSGNLSRAEKDFLYRCLHFELTSAQKIHINELLWKSGAIDLTVELIAQLIVHVKKNLLTEYHETPTRMKWAFSLVDITKEIMIPFKREASRNGWMKYEYDETMLRALVGQLIALENESKSRRLATSAK